MKNHTGTFTEFLSVKLSISYYSIERADIVKTIQKKSNTLARAKTPTLQQKLSSDIRNDLRKYVQILITMDPEELYSDKAGKNPDLSISFSQNYLCSLAVGVLVCDMEKDFPQICPLLDDYSAKSVSKMPIGEFLDEIQRLIVESLRQK